MSKLLLSPSIQSPIGVFVIVSQETEKAYLISFPAGKIWLPKKILNRQNGKRKVDPETNKAHDYLVPERWFIDKNPALTELFY